MINIDLNAFYALPSQDKLKVAEDLINESVAIMYRYGCILTKADKKAKEFSFSIPCISEIGKDPNDPWNSKPITMSEMIEEINSFCNFLCAGKATVLFDYRPEPWTKVDYDLTIKKQEEDKKAMEATATKLNTIQKHNNLNEVHRNGEIGPGGAYHHYTIYHGLDPERDETRTDIKFQKGPRNEEGSIGGVLDGDLLEIVRDRLVAFQAGPYACVENAEALKAVELALMWMNRRAEERASRGVLGTTKV